jgi:hypothetical protein
VVKQKKSHYKNIWGELQIVAQLSQSARLALQRPALPAASGRFLPGSEDEAKKSAARKSRSPKAPAVQLTGCPDYTLQHVAAAERNPTCKSFKLWERPANS